jgi:hypothetical protein
MLIRFNALGRATPEDLEPILPALAEAADEIEFDVGRLTVLLDWVQYRSNFREPVVARPFLPRDDGRADAPVGQLAIDVRRAAATDLLGAIRTSLPRLHGEANPNDDEADRIYLEDRARPSKSLMWSFNKAYWEHLSSWESTFQKDYLAALPGGVSDGMHPDFWHDAIGEFIEVLVELEERSQLPEEIPVLELGVGTGDQARVWLDTFQTMCGERGKPEYYDRVHYLMTDYSPDVLASARVAVGPHAPKVTHYEIDFGSPLDMLASWRHRVLFAHSCNLYDNLPTDEVIRFGTHLYEALVRAYVPRNAVEELAATYELDADGFVELVGRLLAEGPKVLGEVERGIHFWSELWSAVRLDEAYMEVADPSRVQFVPSAALRLSDIVDALPPATRVHLSSVALENFVQSLTLIHPRGSFRVLDLFVRNLTDYASFRGPGKLDGSIVNWLNGPLFQQLADRLGFDVTLERFPYREGSNTTVLTARRR